MIAVKLLLTSATALAGMALVATSLLAPAAPLAGAFHFQTDYTGPTGFETYFLGGAANRVDWKACEMSAFEENTFGVSFNNWVSRFAQGTSHTQQADGCSFAASTELVVDAIWILDPNYPCGSRQACFIALPQDYVVQWNQVCGCNVTHVTRATIVFDYVYFHVLWDIGKQMHIFAHELGHAMGIGHSHSCGQSVMSGVGCTDLVHPFPPLPPDLRTP
jgi:hypothetical protein